MSSNRLLLIIAGESFREGGQGSRSKDTPKSLTSQLLACDSHIKFIEHLKNKYNIDVDIQLISYNTKYEKELIEKYNQYNVQYKFYDKYYQDRTQLINSWKLEDIDKSYDSILVIRPDMYLKEFFYDIFDPYINKISYASVCFVGAHRVFDIPRANDAMVFIPKKYFDLVYYTIGIKVYHAAIKEYIDHSNQIGRSLNLYNDFDFLIKTPHDSDTEKDYHPLYYLVSRPECKKWQSYGYEIRDIDFLPIETNQYLYNFPDWNFWINNVLEQQYKNTQNIEDIWEWWDTHNGYPKFIDIIELKFDNCEKLNIVSPKRCHLESYWSIDNNYILKFYNENKEITSILYKYNDCEFRGKSLKSNNYFILKKTKTNLSNKFYTNSKITHRPLKVALCIRGAVSKLNSASIKPIDIYNIDHYIDYKSVYRSIETHILNPNKHMHIDIFIHSWSTDLELELNKIYKPLLSMYENNNIYIDEILNRCDNINQFSGISQALAIKRVIQLKESYEQKNNFEYDFNILYRPDVIIWKDILLNNYNINNNIYVNAHENGGGDFHFIMSSHNLKKFKTLYDFPLISQNKNTDHGWIKNFIMNYMKQNLELDNIVPGRDQEVARPSKLRQNSIEIYNIDSSIFSRYGISIDYIYQ
jgi:hypothetical protein